MMAAVSEVTDYELAQLSHEGHKVLLLEATPNGQKVIIFTKNHKIDWLTHKVEFISPKHSVEDAVTSLNSLFTQSKELEIIELIGDLGVVLGGMNDRIAIDLLKDVFKSYRNAGKDWRRLIDHLKKSYKK